MIQKLRSIDHNVIEELKGQLEGDISIILEVIDVYLRSSPLHMTNIRECFFKKDIDSVFKAAHSLKSSSKSLGALRMGEYCQMMEGIKGADPHGDLSQFRSVCENMEQEFSQVLVDLKQLKQILGTSE